MAKTFTEMVSEAQDEVPGVSAEEARQRLEQSPGTMIVDVRDAGDLVATGIIPGAVNVSLGTLPFKADQDVPEAWRDPRVQDRSQPIITTCYSGECAALAGKLLKDMGFTNVSYLQGGTVAWKESGLPVE